MAITKCKECNKDVSTQAVTCPHCGVLVVKRKPGGCLQVVALGMMLIILGAVALQPKKTAPNFQVVDPLKPNNTSIAQTTPVDTATASQAGKQWYYSQDNDAMGKGKNYVAVALSSNQVSFKFPYSGLQRGQLIIRDHHRHGKGVLFSIERGQILCYSYQTCQVLVRFDDDKALTLTGVGAADNSTDKVFIKGYQQFMDKMQKAKRVRIAVNIYQEGEPVFDFDVYGFDWGRFRPKS